MSDQFIEHVNSTPRTFGHNKLQIDIQELQKTIEKLNLANNEKDMKVALFKKSISAIQQQLIDKASQVSLLEEKVENLSTTLTQLANSNELQVDLELEEQEKERTKQLLLKKDSKIRDLELLTKTQLERLEQTSSELKILKSSFEEQTRVLIENEKTITILKQQTSKLVSTNDSVQDELQSLKNDLAYYKMKVQEQIVHINDIQIEKELTIASADAKSIEASSDKNVDEHIPLVGQPKRRGEPKRRR